MQNVVGSRSRHAQDEADVVEAFSALDVQVLGQCPAAGCCCCRGLGSKSVEPLRLLERPRDLLRPHKVELHLLHRTVRDSADQLRHEYRNVAEMVDMRAQVQVTDVHIPPSVSPCHLDWMCRHMLTVAMPDTASCFVRYEPIRFGNG